MLSLNQTEEHPSYIALEQFGDDLYEATDGRLEVEVYPHETLGAQKEVVQLVGDGAVDTAFDDIDHPLRVVNGEATDAATEKANAMRERFAEWVWEDPDRTERLTERYNRMLNSTVLRSYDGSHRTLPGLSLIHI